MKGEEWREWYRLHPGGIAVMESPTWMEGGCPRCNGKKWEATGDCWVYCLGCSKGYPTAFPFCGLNENKVFDFENPPGDAAKKGVSMHTQNNKKDTP
jgi:hypothetical protein